MTPTVRLLLVAAWLLACAPAVDAQPRVVEQTVDSIRLLVSGKP